MIIFLGQPCVDENPKCEVWATRRQSCRTHPAYMLKYCKVSCNVCRKGMLNKSLMTVVLTIVVVVSIIHDTVQSQLDLLHFYY